jgi:UDP-N-acetylmuramoylalanine--D-glutamate ligase
VRGELSLFASALADLKTDLGYAPKVVAITGTNGKTTTTSLTAQLIERAGLRVSMAGNIGPTLLDTLRLALDAEPAREPACEQTELAFEGSDPVLPAEAEVGRRASAGRARPG